MDAVDPLRGPSSVSMTLSENFKFNPKAVNISLPKIMSYLPLAKSSTCQFHVMIFIALSLVNVKYIQTFRLAVIIPACVCHCITASSLGVIFVISLTIKILELNPLSNMLRKFLNFAQPFRVFIYPCRIWE